MSRLRPSHPPSPLHSRLVLAPRTLPPRPHVLPFRIEARIVDDPSLVSSPPPPRLAFYPRSYSLPCIRTRILLNTLLPTRLVLRFRVLVCVRARARRRSRPHLLRKGRRRRSPTCVRPFRTNERAVVVRARTAVRVRARPRKRHLLARFAPPVCSLTLECTQHIVLRARKPPPVPANAPQTQTRNARGGRKGPALPSVVLARAASKRQATGDRAGRGCNDAQRGRACPKKGCDRVRYTMYCQPGLVSPGGCTRTRFRRARWRGKVTTRVDPSHRVATTVLGH